MNRTRKMFRCNSSVLLDIHKTHVCLAIFIQKKLYCYNLLIVQHIKLVWNIQEAGNVNLSVAATTALLLGEPLGTINFVAKIIVLLCNLCRAKASPNRRGAGEGGGEVNGLIFITNLWIINTCDVIHPLHIKKAKLSFSLFLVCL